MAFANPVEVASPVAKVFVPEGFDDNDNAEIVLHGEYPNTCYQVGRTAAKVDEKTREIMVWAISLKYPGENCQDVKVPFTQVVELGILKQGDYKIVLNPDANIGGTLTVARRHVEAPEDHLYAPVTNASLGQTDDAARQTLTLSGEYPYMFIGCMVIDEVRTTLTSGNVLVVQPIAKIAEDETPECQNQTKDKAFKVTKELDTMLQGQGLIHVRVLNGDAINQIVHGK